MAKKQITQLIDDLDGSVLEDWAGVTLRFSLEGRSYEIDLSDSNAAKFRDALAPFIAAARPTSGAASAARSLATRASGRSADLAGIRAWASENGYTVSSRGRVPQSVVEAYEASR
ncbi:Lsr2 family protein [Microbacterium sp.]|uniref:histone-like nucleoid-structuring protein Lsr2 n=1 Tax=Microbacterium sp. TaxID=51671 RepID=UPI0025CBAE7A|nr:Lsr2 family protein [Microbacterium sp.]MBT9607752.1 Lsr2 family protein [Microbacterium sp.]